MSYPDFIWMVIQRIGGRYLIAASVAFLIFYVLFRKRWSKKKLQSDFPKQQDYLRDFAFSVASVVIFSFIALLTFRILRPFSQLYSDIEAHSIGYYAFSFVFLLFIHDAYFYLIHRLMHQPKLFKYVHLIHHKSTNPSPWTAYAFHPLEAILEALIIPIITCIIPVHVSVIGFLMLFQIFYNVYGHLGYELFPKNFHKTWVGRYVNTSVAHNQHHHRFHGNYGLYTLIWDRLFNTIREDYEQEYEKVN